MTGLSTFEPENTLTLMSDSSFTQTKKAPQTNQSTGTMLVTEHLETK